MTVRHLNEATRTGEYSRPRTALAFLSILVATIVGGAVGAVAILAREPDLRWGIPWVLGFAAFVAVATLITVLVLLIRDPTVLLLGQVTGREFLAHRVLTMGDNITGEHIEHVVAPLGHEALASTALVPSGVEETEEEDGE